MLSCDGTYVWLGDSIRNSGVAIVLPWEDVDDDETEGEGYTVWSKSM